MKRHLLVFDRIAWSEAERYADAYRDSSDRQAEVADIEWLLQQGLVFAPEYRLGASLTPQGEEELQAVQMRQRAGVRESIASYGRGEDGKVHLYPALDAGSRVLALQLRELDGLNAVPIITAWGTGSHDTQVRAQVVRVLLNDLPLPADIHSFADILAFREEAKAQGLTQGLRAWISDMASGKLTPIEVSDKLEDLASRYERALRLEKMSRTTGVIETLIVTTAEIAESLVKFQWSNVAKKLFEVRHKQIDLMKAEMTLPGHEVAYIVKARERFGT